MDCTKLTREDEVRVFEALRWFGMPTAWFQRIEVTDSGQVFVGLTEILPKNSVNRIR